MISDCIRKNFLFSKFFDYCLLYISGVLLFAISPFFFEGIVKYLFISLIPFLWLPIGAFLLNRYGKTPGMMLFGLQAKSDGNRFISWKSAFRQSMLPLPDEEHGIELSSSASWLRQVVAIAIATLGVVISFIQPDMSCFSSNVAKSLMTTEWVEYSDDDKNFSIQFPTDPSEKDKTLNLPSDKSLPYTEVTSQEKKAIYSLTYMKLPKKWGLAGDNTILKVALDLIVKHTREAQLVSKKMTSHKESRAIDFIYTEGANEVAGRLVLVGNKLYKLTIKYPKGQSGKAAVEEFLSSFEPHIS